MMDYWDDVCWFRTSPGLELRRDMLIRRFCQRFEEEYGRPMESRSKSWCAKNHDAVGILEEKLLCAHGRNDDDRTAGPLEGFVIPMLATIPVCDLPRQDDVGLAFFDWLERLGKNHPDVAMLVASTLAKDRWYACQEP